MSIQHTFTRLGNWIKNNGVAIDILACSLSGGNERQTVSGRCGHAIAKGNRCILCKPLCWLIQLKWPEHCKRNAIRDDQIDALIAEPVPLDGQP